MKSLTSLWRNFGPPYVTFVLWDLRVFVFIQSSLKILWEHFNRVGVWTMLLQIGWCPWDQNLNHHHFMNFKIEHANWEMQSLTSSSWVFCRFSEHCMISFWGEFGGTGSCWVASIHTWMLQSNKLSKCFRVLLTFAAEPAERVFLVFQDCTESCEFFFFNITIFSLCFYLWLVFLVCIWC